MAVLMQGLFMHNLGELLRLNRLELGHSQANVAMRSGTSIPTLRLCEKSLGTIQSYLSLVDALGRKLRWTGFSTDENYGKILALRRKKRGLSQRAIANAIGVTQPTIVTMERQFKGRVETLEKLLTFLKLKPRLEVMGAKPTLDFVDPGRTKELLEVLFNNHDVSDRTPHFVLGEALETLARFPNHSVDCVMTSPPYWLHREYESGGFGGEKKYTDYIANIAKISSEIHRVLKPSGSYWLNVGDTYRKKRLLGIPWRVSLELMDNQGWILRNSIIWNKRSGAIEHSLDRLTNKHEHIFHFVKNRNYYYDLDAVRNAPGKIRIEDGKIFTASGTSTDTYRKQIEESNDLNEQEKQSALTALAGIDYELESGMLFDFRMIIRGRHRVMHSDVERISQRATRLREDGFYFMRFNPKGSKPGDVWDISPRGLKGSEPHFAVYPEKLCRIPILTTCPLEGIVLDPFCGSGTTMKVAQELGRRSIGIDLSEKYLGIAKRRCADT